MKSSIILIFLDLAADIMTCLDNSYREKRWVKLVRIGYRIGIDISCGSRSRSRRPLQKEYSGFFKKNKEVLSNSTDIAKANIM